MTTSFLHGIETIEVSDGIRPVVINAQAVILIVGTAPLADPVAWPYDEPRLLLSQPRLAATLGSAGTLLPAIRQAYVEGGTCIVVVRVQIMAGGVDIGAAIGGREIEGSIDEHVGGKADKLSLTVSNWDGGLAKPTKGQKLTVSLGYVETGLEPMGEFVVEDVGKEGPVATFTISAHAADFLSMLKAKRTRVFEATTFGALVSAMAQDAGLQPSIDPSLASIAIVHEPQTEESDMHMLTRLARRFDAVAKPGNGKLVVVPRGGGTNGEGDALDAMTVTPNDLTKWHFGGGNRPKHGVVTADYYDKDQAQRVPKTAGEDGDPEYHLGHLHPDADHAQKHADATSKQFKRKEQRMTGEMWGQPWVHAGSLYTTDGFGDDDDRSWTMVTAKHLFGSKSGLATHFEGEPKD